MKNKNNMKKLDVNYTFNGSTGILNYDVPNSVTFENVENSILSKFEALQNGELIECSIVLYMDNSTQNIDSELNVNTTTDQFINAINGAVSFIGGRGRRG